jgi:uncharacterized protein
VKIRIEDIKETEKEAAFVEEIIEMNESLAATDVVDFQFAEAVPVGVTYYRLGPDLLFRGHFAARVAGTCARCLESYPFAVERDFNFLLKPAAAGAKLAADEDLALSFYAGDEVDLSPLVREAMILALPTRPLCREDCPGLCPHCGANRGANPCGCREDSTDPRLAMIRSLKRPS